MESRYYFKPNTIYCGDNLKILKAFPDECVDLIYIDPPFFSGKNYDLVFDDKFAIRAFQDTFEGNMESYLLFMEDRIREMYRTLKSTGTFYLHCDHHANSYLKQICNKVFSGDKYSDKNFLSEIIWHYTGGGRSKKYFSHKHDTIYSYRKGKNCTFNIDDIRVPYGKNSGYAKGGIVSKSGKKYMPHPDGKVMDDVWDIPIINPMSKERLNYPTQKPEKLLKIIIKASSNEGDIIADFFCGCGTTLAVAQKLNRQWVGIDVSPIGCTVISKRIDYQLKNVQGMKYSLEQAKKLDWMDFQKWTIKAIDGIPLTKKGADGGIDGWQNDNKFNESVPVEVKQNKINSDHVMKLNTVIEREKRKVDL